MTDTYNETMYTLGQLARAVWPTEDVPESILNILLVQPATGLALLVKHEDTRRADPEAIAALVSRLPSGLRDPVGGIKMEHQGPFWFGYYHYLSAIERAKAWGPAQLERAGNLLYGDRWQTDLARALEINDRRVRQWMSIERPIPPGVWADIAALLRHRQQAGALLLREMDQGK